MHAQRTFHTATSLAGGAVLIAGGGGASAELYEPSTGTFTPTGSMSRARSGHTATELASGKVLMAGGWTAGIATSTVELYDPQTGNFPSSCCADMSVARSAHTATRLADGTVLIAGGQDSEGTSLGTAEIFDPATGSFTATGGMNRARSYHTATLLLDGNVLITGGFSGGVLGGSIQRSSEIYDAAVGSFRVSGQMITERYAHFATLLPTGRVLVSGGDFISFGFLIRGYLAETYDPATGLFSQTGSMGVNYTRLLPAAVMLDDQRVLVTGGTGRASAETYQ
jgi:hypothetical protein